MNKLNLLYLTGMFPYDKDPASGIFVLKRIEKLKSLYPLFLNIDVFALVTLYNKALVKIIKKIPEITFNNMYYNFINYIFYKTDFLDLYYKIFFKGKSYLRISHNFFELLRQSHDIGNYNVIHAHFIQLGGFVAYEIHKNYKIPYVITAHGSDVHTNLLKDHQTYVHTLKVMEEAYRVIFVSNYLLGYSMKLGYSGKNAIVIPNGVDVEIFKPLDKDYCRSKIDKLKKDNYTVGYVGSLKKIKGVFFLPRIFKNIKDRVKNVQFLIVGDGELRNFLIEKSKKYNLEIVFLGRVSQEKLNVLYNVMDVLVVPSLKEGFSCAIIEAQACGVPVVGSNVGGIPEAIGGSSYGRVVDLGEDFEERFAESVVDILYNKPKALKLVERARNFSWEKIVEKEVEIYKSIYDSNLR